MSGGDKTKRDKLTALSGPARWMVLRRLKLQRLRRTDALQLFENAQDEGENTGLVFLPLTCFSLLFRLTAAASL